MLKTWSMDQLTRPANSRSLLQQIFARVDPIGGSPVDKVMWFLQNSSIFPCMLNARCQQLFSEPQRCMSTPIDLQKRIRSGDIGFSHVLLSRIFFVPF